MATVPAVLPKEGFVTLLEHLGAKVRHGFEVAEKAILPGAEAIAAGAEPFVDAEFPALGTLFSTTLRLVATAQATGSMLAAGQSSGAAKLAVTAPIVETLGESLLKEFGISVDDATAAAFTTSVVNIANLFQVPASTTPAAA